MKGYHSYLIETAPISCGSLEADHWSVSTILMWLSISLEVE